MVARTLVSSKAKAVPVQLMNASDEAKLVYKSTTAAMAEPVVDMADPVQEPNLSKKCELPEHLKELFKSSTKNLSAKQKDLFKHFLVKYQHVFSAYKEDIGRTNLIQHRLKIKPGVEPIKQRPYRQPPIKERRPADK